MDKLTKIVHFWAPSTSETGSVHNSLVQTQTEDAGKGQGTKRTLLAASVHATLCALASNLSKNRLGPLHFRQQH